MGWVPGVFVWSPVLLCVNGLDARGFCVVAVLSVCYWCVVVECAAARDGPGGWSQLWFVLDREAGHEGVAGDGLGAVPEAAGDVVGVVG